MCEIKVSDIVQVTDWGRAYDTAYAWICANKDALQQDWLIRYAFGGGEDKYDKCKYTDTDTYEVLYIANGRAMITRSKCDWEPIYIVGVDALSLYITPKKTKKMTVSEIEDILGYRIEIVSKEEE